MRYPAKAVCQAFREPDAASKGIWTFAAALPPASQPVTLGEGRTPLLDAPTIAEARGLDRVWLKLEGSGPTGSWKDRLNAVTVTMARESGAPGIVCSSTGNQGVSLAAFAAAAGLPAVVLFPNEAPQASVRQAQFHGAQTVVTDWATRAKVLDALLRDRGWSLSNRNDPRPWANPFGIEGYRTIAFEIIRELKLVPDAVVVPTCGADGLYGIWKGFRELYDVGLVDSHPRMIAVQPENSASLVEALDRNADTVDAIPLRISAALSLTDERSGRLGLAAVRESGGAGLTVSEADIEHGVGTLARMGLCAEPAAAAGVAAMARLPTGVSSAVIIVTASGVRWPATFANVKRPLVSSSADDIVSRIAHP